MVLFLIFSRFVRMDWARLKRQQQRLRRPIREVPTKIEMPMEIP